MALQCLPDDGTIDVWTISLRLSAAEMDRLSAVLSADEHARQARILAGTVRERFTAGRARLRMLLARYLGIEPAAIEFTYAPRGKPAIAGTDLRFNLAHSDDVAVCAIAKGHEVGIDIERLREIPDMRKIANRFFATEERSALDALPATDRILGFYLAWTRKEAYVKAVGDGLHIPLDNFSVTLVPGEPARLIGFAAGPANDWNLHHLEPEAGFVGAVAYQGERKMLKLFRDAALDS